MSQTIDRVDQKLVMVMDALKKVFKISEKHNQVDDIQYCSKNDIPIFTPKKRVAKSEVDLNNFTSAVRPLRLSKNIRQMREAFNAYGDGIEEVEKVSITTLKNKMLDFYEVEEEENSYEKSYEGSEESALFDGITKKSVEMQS